MIQVTNAPQPVLIVEFEVTSLYLTSTSNTNF